MSPEAKVTLEIDPDYQFKALIDFSVTNPYRPLINNTQATALYNSYYENCLPALNNCTSSDSNEACSNAAITCLTDINDQFEDVDFDIYDIRQGSDMAFPPVTYVNYLQDSKIQARIGAQVQFQNCSISVFNNFVNTGDCRPPHVFNLVHGVGSPNPQMHAVSSMTSARW
jgi:carboxypeptidase C (cathepsin A)